MNNDRFKFRAWDGKSMHEAFSYFISHDNKIMADIITIGFRGSRKVSSYMQSIGQKDLNGKLCFENDIVEMPNGKWCLISYWTTYHSLVLISPPTTMSEMEGEPPWDYLHDSCLGESEIIGNIHENPELLIPTSPAEKELE